MENEQTEKKSRIKERSVAYPGISLEEATVAIAELRKSMGKGPYSREVISEGLGYGGKLNGSSVRKIAALVHFGLLSREGNTYSQTMIAEHIINYIDEEEKKNALMEAVKNPTLYASLIDEYNNHALPAMLDKIMIRKGIGQKVADQAADTFKKSLEFASMLKNGVVCISIGEEADNDIQNSTFIQEKLDINQPNRRFDPTTNTEIQSIHLPCGLIISYPKKLGYVFAIGKFGTQIAALDETVNNELKRLEEESKLNGAIASE